MYRDKIRELMMEKGISNKQMAMESGVSTDTLSRIMYPDNPEKDSPHVSTLERICKSLGVELWELFYIGEKSLVGLQAELTAVRAERDELIAEKAKLAERTAQQQERIDGLIDNMLLIINHCKQK